MIEDLDIEAPNALASYLRSTGRIAQSETPLVQVLGGGVSNRAVLVHRSTGESWVVKQALEKLRVQSDWYSSPTRIHREAAALRCLSNLTPESTATFVFEDFDFHLLGMSAIPQPHENWKTVLLAGLPSDHHIVQFATLLAGIHRRAAERGQEISQEFSDRAFFESLRIEPYYEFTADRTPEVAPFYRSLIDDTRKNAVTLVHGDYSPKNVLVWNDRLVLLDHEVVHWGDPAFDVGFSMTHLLSKANHCADRRSELTGAARLYWTTYIGTLGNVEYKDGLEERALRHLLGCLLARVDGRSPLEYLTIDERQRQRDSVVELMGAAPSSLDHTILEFVRLLE